VDKHKSHIVAKTGGGALSLTQRAIVHLRLSKRRGQPSNPL